MLFYILLLVVIFSLFFVSYRYPNIEKTISLLLLTALILISGFRDRIGWDYNSYVNWYLTGSRDSEFEFGFLAIMKIFRYLNLDYRCLFFFFSFFTYLFAYLAIRKYTKKSTLPLVLCFLVPVFFLYSFTYIRQYLSITIAFYAFSFLLDKKYFHYIFWMILGTSFHYSCAIPFLIFFLIYLYGDCIKYYHLYLLMLISFVFSRVGIIDWISLFLKDSHYFYYVSSKLAVKVPLLKLLAINMMGVLLIEYYERKGFKDSCHRYLLLTYVCSILFLNVFSESTELTRIYIYFRIFEIILVAEIIYYVLTKRKFFLLGFLFCFYVFAYFRALKLDTENSLKEEYKFIPYKSILFTNQKIYP